eukprot:4642582-Amphidinium_carterae.1
MMRKMVPNVLENEPFFCSGGLGGGVGVDPQFWKNNAFGLMPLLRISSTAPCKCFYLFWRKSPQQSHTHTHSHSRQKSKAFKPRGLFSACNADQADQRIYGPRHPGLDTGLLADVSPAPLSQRAQSVTTEAQRMFGTAPSTSALAFPAQIGFDQVVQEHAI